VTASLLARRRFRLVWLVWLAIFLDTLLFTGVLPLLPSLGESECLSDGGLGIILAAYSFSGLFLCLPFGLASDCWRPRPILIFGIIGVAMGGLIISLAPTPWGIGVGRFMQGMSSAALWTSGMAIASQQAGPGKRAQAIGQIYSAASAGELAGPLLSGFLFERTGITTFFRLVAILGAALAAGAILISKGQVPGERREWPGSVEMQGGRDWALWGNAGLFLIIISIFSMMLLFSPLLMFRRFAFGPAAIGLALMGWNLAVFGSQILGGRWADRAGGRLPLMAGLAATGAGLAGLAVAQTAWQFLPALYLVGGGAAITATVVTAQFSTAWERRKPAGTGLGAAFGASNTVWSLGFLIGNGIGGWLVTVVPVETVLWGLGALLVPFVVVAAAYPLLRRGVRSA